jgi:hypothetical protein
MIYLMIGQDDIAFSRARSFVAQNASKLMFPATVRLSEIPQMLEAAVMSVDISTFATAENAAVTELKAALNSANAQDFVKYVDRGLDMVREILRGKLKVPKLISRLELPIDCTFKETFPIGVVISNTGDGDALGLSVEWYVDEGLSTVSGEKKKSLPSLRAGQSIKMDLRARSARPDLMGEKEYEVMVRGNYSDMLKTEYSLQAGPGMLLLRDYKMTEKLLHDADVSDTRIGLLNSTIDSTSFEKEVLLRVTSILTFSLKTVRDELAQKKMETARARIGVINELIDSLDSVLGDEALAESVAQRREAEKRSFARALIDPIHSSLRTVVAQHQKTLDEQTRSAFAEWDRTAEKKKELSSTIREANVELSDLVRELESLHNQMPAASATDAAEEAARRTKLRTWVDGIKTKTDALRSRVGGLTANPILVLGSRPAVPEKVELASRLLKSVNEDLGRVVQSKKAELE